MIKIIKKLVCGIRTLNVPRAEDLPYWSSPPIQFVYEQTAALVLGNYIFTGTAPTALTPNRPILDNALYFFRNISLAADIVETDFVQSIVTTIQFNTFRVSDALAVLFREPIVMNKFYDQFDYRLWWESQQASDQLRANFAGQIVQSPPLIGKASITLKAIISAQEVVDENFKFLFRSKYPNISVQSKDPMSGGDYGE